MPLQQRRYFKLPTISLLKKLQKLCFIAYAMLFVDNALDNSEKKFLKVSNIGALKKYDMLLKHCCSNLKKAFTAVINED